MNEHDYEPIPGLPAPLPHGETILWQGSPEWRTLARRVMRMRLVGVYFLILIAWCISGGVSAGTPSTEIAVSALRLGALGIVALALLGIFAWLIARTTVYTITTRRVVMRFGIALPITLQIAFPMIEGAAMNRWADGTGDISIALRRDQRAAYLMVWPHARPWKLLKAEPSLRGLTDVAGPAQILGPRSRGICVAAGQAGLDPSWNHRRQRFAGTGSRVTEKRHEP